MTLELHHVLPSVACALGAPGHANDLALPEANRYVVLLVDGLGWVQLAEFAAEVPFLAEHLGAPLVADFPTTTSVGLASLGTGLSPGDHGVVGASFRVPELDVILNPLHWPDDVPAQLVQPLPTMFQQLAASGFRSALVGSAQYADSGLTRAALRGAEYRVAEDAEALIARTSAGDEPCTYVYWSALDRVGHSRGVGSSAWVSELRQVDSLVRQLHAACSDAALVVTADHGMVNVEHRFQLDDHPLLMVNVETIAGEPRARHVYLRDPLDQRTLETWREVLAPCAEVMDRKCAWGLFGSTTPENADRIGDLIALPKPGWLLTARFDARLGALPGQHGGLTDEERLIPGIVLAP